MAVSAHSGLSSGSGAIAHERAQRSLAVLRAAILERAFSGELVPQDPADEPAEALLARIRAERDAEPVRAGRRRKSE